MGFLDDDAELLEPGAAAIIAAEFERSPDLGAISFRIVDEDGEVAGPNEEGVIHLKSLVGQDFECLNAPEKTAEAHSEPGFITMGDIGYLDEGGFLYIVDRKKDMILSGGQNIYPQDIEAVLVDHPAIDDVAVIGAASKRWGETPVALVVLRTWP